MAGTCKMPAGTAPANRIGERRQGPERAGMDDGRYYYELAGAFLKGRGLNVDGAGPCEMPELAREHGLTIHKFKRTAGLPRVRRVLGTLQGLMPEHLLDVGGGRGAFLWPLLDELRELPVTAVDLRMQHVRDLGAVHRGGVRRLLAVCADMNQLPFREDSFDVATALEVLEHLEHPQRAAVELLRVTRRFVIISVPSKRDDNPEHLHLLSEEAIEAMFVGVGATRVSFEHVLNHTIAVIGV